MMITQFPIINTTKLSDEIYSINNVESSYKKNIQILYLEFSHNSISHNSISHNSICSKHIVLKEFIIEYDTKNKFLFSNLNNNITNIIKNQINIDFIKKCSELGEAHRKIINNDLELDLNKSISYNEKINLLNLYSNIIANNSKIGPAQWLILNNKTCDSLKIFDSNLVGIKCIIDRNVEDDTILIGRSNTIEQPSIQVFIETDKNKNIIFDKKIYNGHVQLKMYYLVSEYGADVCNNFIKIKTTDIMKQRYLKLKKINEIYDIN